MEEGNLSARLSACIKYLLLLPPCTYITYLYYSNLINNTLYIKLCVRLVCVRVCMSLVLLALHCMVTLRCILITYRKTIWIKSTIIITSTYYLDHELKAN
jgi:hypothetical protein